MYKDSYKLIDVNDFDKFNESKSYLILFAIDQVPPHIGLVHDKNYYSLSTKGKKTKFPVLVVLDSIRRKKLPCVFIEFDTGLNALDIEVEFGRWDKVEIGSSCLQPIINVLSTGMTLSSEDKFVFHVISRLKENDAIRSITHSYCTDFIKEQTLTLPQYGQKEIDQAILNYQHLC